MRNKNFLYSFLLLVGVSYLLCLILGESEVFWALLSKVGYSGTTRAIFIPFLKLTGCSGRLALVLFFAVKAVNGTLFKDFFSCMEEAGPSSGASSSNPGNPVVPPIDQGLHGEVKKDEVWGVWTHLREFGEFPIPTPKESTVLQPAVLETPRDGGPFTRGATPQASPQQTSPSLVEGAAKLATNEAAAGCAQACSEGLIQRAAHCPDCFWDCVAGSCCLFCS
ncbi:unnamed protein product [Vicia faba]|uniref:Uncharacterized protein n=1 Tax=Vicia faba TaxID=3906 RepID=A0AAV1B6B3_VICFA|nr:unnamed protein product [Vicia faba]